MDNTEFLTALKHDLRQDRAKLIGDTLEAIHMARREKDYPRWFEELRNLKVDVVFKFIPSDKDKLKDMEKELSDAIKNNEHAYSNKNTPASERGKIEDKLRAINEFLIEKMDKYKFFGSGDYIETL